MKELNTNKIEVFSNSILVGEVKVDWDFIEEEFRAAQESNVTLQAYLAKAVQGLDVQAPAARWDSSVLESNRALVLVKRDYLVENSKILEKTFRKVLSTLFGQNQSFTITQSVLIKDLFTDKAKSLAATAQALYFLSETGIFNMVRKTTTRDGATHTYFVVELGEKFPTGFIEVKQQIRKIAKQNKRKHLDEATTKEAKRNNSKALYPSFDSAEFAQKAVSKMTKFPMRLVIPEHISYDEVVQNIFKYDPNNENQQELYAETIQWIEETNGKTFYVEKTLDRSLRIFGFKTLDITASSDFRPFLRLPKKRKVSARGAFHYNLFKHTLIGDGAPQWYINEVSNITAGSYTNVMIEVDANNQGPAIVAALLEDAEWLQKYWGDKDSEKMYEVFKNALLGSLNLSHNLLETKDVKYKIMTKAYNKTNKANIFGDKDFLNKLDQAYLKGLYLARFDFYELPLKMQLQDRLAPIAIFNRMLSKTYSWSSEPVGSLIRYNPFNVLPSDARLESAYTLAVDKAAPFLEQFRVMISELQNQFQVKPSIYKWKAIDEDGIQSARSTYVETPVDFYDLTGTKHTITYRQSVLIEQNKFGGETALSPTFVQSLDSWIARHIILDAPHEIYTNHDAFFVHGNDVDYVEAKYVELFKQIPSYGRYWFQSMKLTYGIKNKAFDSMNSFAEMTGLKNKVTQAQIDNLDNLVGI